MVRIATQGFGHLNKMELRSRCIRKNGLLLEVTPPLPISHPFGIGQEIECKVRLPHQDETLVLKGNIAKVVLRALDPQEQLISVVGIHFVKLGYTQLQKLEAHDIAIQAGREAERVIRIRVSFPLELIGIDLMSPLFVLDMSMTGMFVGGRAKFQKGKELKLKFRLPFQKREVSLIGKVVWSGQKQVPGIEKKCNGFGVQFVDTPAPARMALATYYARNTIQL